MIKNGIKHQKIPPQPSVSWSNMLTLGQIGLQ